MKKFLKYFSLAFICFFIAFLLGSYAFMRTDKNIIDNSIDKNIKFYKKDTCEEKKKRQKKTITSLEEGIKDSDRVNFIVLGMDDIRTDTILFASFDRKYKKVDLIFIPRDTYLYRKGYEKAEQRKINAVYAAHGISGVKKSVQYILKGVPIHYYVIVDYEGVENMVDSIGGVEVNVPFHMKYKDSTAKPPLYIDIPKGQQVLKGKKAVQFLRYRKGNKGKSGYKKGDLGRIESQQEFLTSFLKKSLGTRMPLVIKSGFKYVKTNVNLKEALNYGKEALEMEEKDFKFTILPGMSTYRKVQGKTLSYYIQDEIKTKELVYKMYGVLKKVPKK